VQARTLVLVNWKGVFYERYVLDEHVTALEGNNGAGKTTVMIAAYVVMLPDMTRLRLARVIRPAAIKVSGGASVIRIVPRMQCSPSTLATNGSSRAFISSARVNRPSS
jgi:recombinational DNA repair ATPase RecF